MFPIRVCIMNINFRAILVTRNLKLSLNELLRKPFTETVISFCRFYDTYNLFNHYSFRLLLSYSTTYFRRVYIMSINFRAILLTQNLKLILNESDKTLFTEIVISFCAREITTTRWHAKLTKKLGYVYIPTG